MRWALLLGCLLWPALSLAGPRDLAHDPRWLALLHMVPDCVDHHSEVDAPGFFLHPDGATDPAAELAATRAAFLAAPASGDDRPQCLYPDRYAFFQAAEGWTTPRGPCPALDRALGGPAPTRASLTFAHYYLGNPASALGHVMLRLEGPEVDDAVSFAADPEGANPVSYLLQGAGGGFQGRFTVEPFHSRLRTYVRAERRDLWVYPLSLSPGQIHQLRLHLWALRRAWFDYYFFDENCAYHLAGLLEAVAPEIRLKRHLGAVVLPVDLVRLAEAAGLLGEATLLPSDARAAEARREGLTDGERATLDRWLTVDLTTPARPNGLGGSASPALIDAALRALELSWPQPVLPPRTEALSPAARWIRARRRHLLLAQMASPAPAPLSIEALRRSAPWLVPPGAGHGVQRTRLLGGADGGGALAIVSHRLALHDLADPQGAYPAAGRLAFLSVEVAARPDDLSAPQLRAAELLNLLSLPDLTGPAWAVEAGVSERPLDGDQRLHAGVGGAVGLSVTARPPLVSSLSLFALADLRLGSPVDVAARFALLGGARAGARLMIRPQINLVVQGRWQADLLAVRRRGWQGEATLRWGLTADLALEIAGHARPDHRGLAGGLAIYW